MKMISSMAMASAIAVLVLAFGGLESAQAGPIVPPGHDVSNMTRAGRIAASRAMRSATRRLRGWPRSAMAVRFKMTSIGDGTARPALRTPDSTYLRNACFGENELFHPD